ncbi:MAG: AMP phosphorylase [Candidatus Nanoarchaeia archaeon]|jgi:AMP phosphorylase
MRFKVKDLNISGGSHYVVVMSEETAALEGVHVSSRVRLADHTKNIIAVVDIAEKGVLDRYELGLFNEVAEVLRVKNGDYVEAVPVSQPKSIEYIKKKLDGLELTALEIEAIVSDIIKNRLSQVEMSAFVTACYTRELTMNETYYLTRSVVDTGCVINFGKGVIADKHCVGGISGNRTTMVLVPIIASLGLTIPKTSSRSITSPSGTADTMEVFAPVELTLKRIKSVVKKAGGCIVWGGNMNLAAADDKLISIRHPLSLDPLGLMLASIMAKKKAVGSTHVIIDIPLGVGAKTKSIGEAKYLGGQFEELGKRLGINVKVLITEGNKPIGRGIGPSLEARDVAWVLEGDPQGPIDLRDKSLYLAGELLELCGKASPGEGLLMAREALDSGRALAKFKEIVKLQGGKYKSGASLKPGKFSQEVKSTRKGMIMSINDDLISIVARMAGAPLDKGAGVYLHKTVDEYVLKGQLLMTVYADNERLLKEAVNKVSKGLFVIK